MIKEDFLNADFRTKRPPKFGLASTNELTHYKHQRLLPRSIIENKNVLDLGSFIGQTADWCLQNNVKKYVGVEICDEFYNTSIDLMNKNHPDSNWEIIHKSIQDYFTEHNEKYDVIFAWGLVHHFYDHVSLIKEMAKRADHIIIMGRNPKVMWENFSGIQTPELLKKLEYDIAYQEFHNGEMTLLYKTMKSIRCTSSNSSIAALETTMALNGFICKLDAYEDFKRKYPNEFGMWFDKVGNYVIEFHNSYKVNTTDYENAHKHWDKPVIDWLK
jgi:SAM-dependent methyltransferase